MDGLWLFQSRDEGAQKIFDLSAGDAMSRSRPAELRKQAHAH
jgi:hypothetical protein